MMTIFTVNGKDEQSSVLSLVEKLFFFRIANKKSIILNINKNFINTLGINISAPTLPASFTLKKSWHAKVFVPEVKSAKSRYLNRRKVEDKMYFLHMIYPWALQCIYNYIFLLTIYLLLLYYF